MNFFVVFVIVGACTAAAGPAPAPTPALASVPVPALAPEAPKPEAEPVAEAQRDKRSHGISGYGAPAAYGIAPAGYGVASAGSPYGGGAAFGGGAFASPCGASAPIAAFGPASAPLLNYGQHANYAPQVAVGGYGAPHYRSDEQEEMSFSDMDQNGSEHVPLSRSYGYDVVPAAASSVGVVSGLGGASGIAGLSGAAVVSSGPAVGVFPNAHVSGCNLPLLLSCSPSVSAGRLVHAQPHYGAASYGAMSYGASPMHFAAAGPSMIAAPLAVGGAYRSADGSLLRDSHDERHHELATPEHLTHQHQ